MIAVWFWKKKKKKKRRNILLDTVCVIDYVEEKMCLCV